MDLIASFKLLNDYLIANKGFTNESFLKILNFLENSWNLEACLHQITLQLTILKMATFEVR